MIIAGQAASKDLSLCVTQVFDTLAYTDSDQELLLVVTLPDSRSENDHDAGSTTQCILGSGMTKSTRIVDFDA